MLAALALIVLANRVPAVAAGHFLPGVTFSWLRLSLPLQGRTHPEPWCWQRVQTGVRPAGEPLDRQPAATQHVPDSYVRPCHWALVLTKITCLILGAL